MSYSIESRTVSGSAGGYMSRAALHAKVARIQKQLADFNWPTSSSTPEGKATIQDLSSKIASNQDRIGQIAAADSAANKPNVRTVQPSEPSNSCAADGTSTSFADTNEGGMEEAFGGWSANQSPF